MNVFMVLKNSTCSVCILVHILFYLLWNMVWFSVQQHTEHTYPTVYKHNYKY